MGINTRTNKTINSDTNTEVPGIKDVDAPNTYSIFSDVAKPKAKNYRMI